MTQILVTLEKDANPSFMRKIFESIKGVMKTSIPTEMIEEKTSSTTTPELNPEAILKEKKNWLAQLDALCNSIDRSAIDFNDERTRYILSK